MCCGVDAGGPGVIGDGKDGSEDDLDAVGAGEVGHGGELSSICSSVSGPVLPAMSLVPARITTTLGWSAITSCRKRTSICGVVWPLMPRLR